MGYSVSVIIREHIDLCKLSHENSRCWGDANGFREKERTMTYEKIVDYVQKKFAKLDVSKIGDVAVQIDVTGEGEGVFYVAVKDGKGAVEPYEYYDHDAKIIADGSDIIAIVDGKLDAVAAFNEGKIRVEGNVEKVAELKNVFGVKKAAPAKKAPAKKAPAKKAAPTKKTEPAKKEEPVKKEEVKAEVKAEAKKPAAKPAKKATTKK